MNLIPRNELFLPYYMQGCNSYSLMDHKNGYYGCHQIIKEKLCTILSPLKKVNKPNIKSWRKLEIKEGATGNSNARAQLIGKKKKLNEPFRVLKSAQLQNPYLCCRCFDFFPSRVNSPKHFLS
ncbi:hypothetical protein ES288_A01G153600v1 [Gossypium darwinii]|uniref:Uncharacterized protein n=2 Tax=Gossypium TaxID=3633 RepID=A0A5D2RTU2_GOSTO|nr:hypothetical protein ES288_A01G153600v1 [Gossypium darwinii]TYI43330.1 hypothetical protein ES332_A01G161200v1 [Gossypium tomentosum]